MGGKRAFNGDCWILRCNPFVKGGLDPVPAYFTLRRNPHPENDLDLSDIQNLNRKLGGHHG